MGIFCVRTVGLNHPNVITATSLIVVDMLIKGVLTRNRVGLFAAFAWKSRKKIGTTDSIYVRGAIFILPISTLIYTIYKIFQSYYKEKRIHRYMILTK